MTTEAVTTMPFQRPARDHIQPNEVRLPCTQHEADAALDLIDRNIDALEVAIAQKKADGMEIGAARAKLLKWESRRTEVAYVAARIDAGMPALDPALADRHSATVTALVAARERVAELEKAARDEKIAAGLRVEAAQKQAAAWEAKFRALEKDAGVPRAPKVTEGEAKKRLAGLIAEVEHQKAQREPDREKTRMAVRSLHESHARTVYAIRSMIAAGARLTPTAAQVLHGCVQGMPAGYFDEWMAAQFRLFLAAALNSTERNGATCVEPDAAEVG